jgi:hypothetical protein
VHGSGLGPFVLLPGSAPVILPRDRAIYVITNSRNRHQLSGALPHALCLYAFFIPTSVTCIVNMGATVTMNPDRRGLVSRWWICPMQDL